MSVYMILHLHESVWHKENITITWFFKWRKRRVCVCAHAFLYNHFTFFFFFLNICILYVDAVEYMYENVCNAIQQHLFSDNVPEMWAPCVGARFIVLLFQLPCSHRIIYIRLFEALSCSLIVVTQILWIHHINGILGISLKWNAHMICPRLYHDNICVICFFPLFLHLLFLLAFAFPSSHGCSENAPCFHFIIRYFSMVFVLFRNSCWCCCYIYFFIFLPPCISLLHANDFKANRGMHACRFFFCLSVRLLPLLFLLLLLLFVALNWIADKYTHYVSLSKLTLTRGLFGKSMKGYGFDCFWVQFAFWHTHTHTHYSISYSSISHP